MRLRARPAWLWLFAGLVVIALGAWRVRAHSTTGPELLVATGTRNGKYYTTGETLELLLQPQRIRTRVIETSGSVENVRLLQKRPALAILQYDVALAAQLGDTKAVYGVALDDAVTLPHVPNIRRVAMLHHEPVHVMMRRDRLPAGAAAATLDALTGRKVCLGPRDSGTRVVALALLAHHGTAPAEDEPLPVPEMVRQLHAGELDAGVYVSSIPSEAVRTLLDDPGMRLLSIDPAVRAAMVTSPAFEATTIPQGIYACQRPEEPPVQTLAAHAVLVTTAEVPVDVGVLTRAIFTGAEFLGISNPKEMAPMAPSLKPHPDAVMFYQKAGYWPPSPPGVFDRAFAWLHATWRVLAILAMLVGAYSGFIKFKRDHTSNWIGRRILAIPLGADQLHSVERLLELRRDINQRVLRRWWRLGELDKPRWQYLHTLIAQRIEDAKGNLTQAFIGAIRSDGEAEALEELRRQIWTNFSRGELGAAQYRLLLDLLNDGGTPPPDPALPAAPEQQSAAPDPDA